MASVADKQEQIDTNLRLLKITNKKTERILESGRVRDIQKQLNVLEKTLNELDELKNTMLKAKFAVKEDEGDVENWASELEDKISVYEGIIDRLSDERTKIETEEEEARLEKQRNERQCCKLLGPNGLGSLFAEPFFF